MLRSLHAKLVLIMVLLVVCLMTIAGAFLINSVNRFFLNEFYVQMAEVFTDDPEFVRDLVTKPKGETDGAEALDQNKVGLLVKSVSPLTTLGVTSRSASEAALERYGLDKPIKVCLKAKGKVLLSFSVGKDSSSGTQSYIQLEGKKEIFLARGNYRTGWSIDISALKPDPKEEAAENSGAENNSAEEAPAETEKSI